MEIQPLPYDAQALARFEREGPFIWLWEPLELACVLGAGTPVSDVNLQRCAAEKVSVYRRKGGGGAVLLGPGNLIVTACYESGQRQFATQWVAPIAEAIARALRMVGVEGATVRGLGDVVLGDRKILGSSLYANRRTVLYQGSLLVDADLNLISHYLPHPSREPDYRQGRPHLHFVTSLAREGCMPEMAPLRQSLQAELMTV